jgi:hypothetical protein
MALHALYIPMNRLYTAYLKYSCCLLQIVLVSVVGLSRTYIVINT